MTSVFLYTRERYPMNGFQMRTPEEECQEILEGVKGVKLRSEDTGVHYPLPGDMHTTTFYQMARAFERGQHRRKFGELFIQRMKDAKIDFEKIQVLMGAATGAIPLLNTLQHFGELAHTRAIFAERNNIAPQHNQIKNELSLLLGRTPRTEEVAIELKMALEDVKQFEKEGELWALGRGFTLSEDELVFIIDDVSTTFRTIRGMIYAAHSACRKRNWDALILGFGVLIDRSPADWPSQEIFAPTLKCIQGLRIPLAAYPASQCPSCKKGVPLVKP